MKERIEDILFEIKLFFRALWWKAARKKYTPKTIRQMMNEYLKNHPNHKGYIVKPVSRGGNEYRTYIGGEFYSSVDGITWTIIDEDDILNGD